MKLKDCKCIDHHDRGVLLMAIDHMMQDRQTRIREIKKESELKGERIYVSSMISYEKEIKELEDTRNRLTNTPNCE